MVAGTLAIFQLAFYLGQVGFNKIMASRIDKWVNSKELGWFDKSAKWVANYVLGKSDTELRHQTLPSVKAMASITDMYGNHIEFKGIDFKGLSLLHPLDSSWKILKGFL